MGDMSKAKPQTKLDAATIHRIAGQAEVSPNTVRRWSCGLPVRPISLRRILEAVAYLDSTRGKVFR